MSDFTSETYTATVYVGSKYIQLSAMTTDGLKNLRDFVRRMDEILLTIKPTQEVLGQFAKSGLRGEAQVRIFQMERWSSDQSSTWTDLRATLLSLFPLDSEISKMLSLPGTVSNSDDVIWGTAEHVNASMDTLLATHRKCPTSCTNHDPATHVFCTYTMKQLKLLIIKAMVVERFPSPAKSLLQDKSSPLDIEISLLEFAATARKICKAIDNLTFSHLNCQSDVSAVRSSLKRKGKQTGDSSQVPSKKRKEVLFCDKCARWGFHYRRECKASAQKHCCRQTPKFKPSLRYIQDPFFNGRRFEFQSTATSNNAVAGPQPGPSSASSSATSHPQGPDSEDECISAICVVNSINKVNRPYLRLFFQNTPIDALLDSGAALSILTQHNLDLIDPTCQLHRTQVNSSASVANGSAMRFTHTVSVPLRLNSRSFRHTFFITPGYSPTILGIDFIRKHNVTISGSSFSIFNTTHVFAVAPPSSQPVRPVKQTHLLPYQAMIIPVKTNLTDDDLYLLPAGTTNPDLFVCDTVGHSNQHTTAHLLVANTSDHPLVLETSDILAEAVPIDATPFDQNRTPVSAVSTQSSASTPTPPPEKVKTFLSKLNILAPKSQLPKYHALFSRYYDVFAHSDFDLGFSDVISHTIKLQHDRPIHVKQFRIPLPHQETIEQYVQDMLQANIIEKAKSRYNSPIFCVTKKNGKLRPVVDLRAINKATIEDSYNIKDVRACLDSISYGSNNVFSAMDLASGFFQQNLEASSRPYTAFTVPGLGQFQFKVSCFGSHGAPASFSALITTCLQGIKNAISYIDDILAHSGTHADHLNLLEKIFSRLRGYNLKLSIAKSHFGAPQIEYLGFTISSKGIAPGTDKVSAIRDAQPPASIRQIRQFVGLASFFRDHVPNFAYHASFLTALTRKESGYKKGPIPEKALQAFRLLQQCLITAPILAYPRVELPYELYTDAATGECRTPNGKPNGGLGAILTQRWPEDGRLRVIAYASRQLREHEKNYSSYMLECAAVVFATEHFHHYLYGAKKFKIFTDHKPLLHINSPTPAQNKTIQQMKDKLHPYTYEIEYRPGTDMAAPDYLSRKFQDDGIIAAISALTQSFLQTDAVSLQFLQPVFELPITNILCAIDDDDSHHTSPLDSLQCSSEEMAQGQLGDPKFNGPFRLLIQKDKTLTSTEKSTAQSFCRKWNLRAVNRLLYSESGEYLRLLLPRNFITQVLQMAHDSPLGGHRDFRRTLDRIKLSFVWPKMEADIRRYISHCHSCQTTQQPQHQTTHTPLHPLPTTKRFNERVHMDLLGPLKSSTRNKYILVITDAFTKFTVLRAIPNKSAPTVAKHFYDGWITLFSAPASILTDNGKEFDNSVVKSLTDDFNIHHMKTTAYHPQTNAQAERFNRTLLGYLRNFVDSDTLNWEKLLPSAQISYNTQIHASTKHTPYYLVFLHDPRLPFSKLSTHTREHTSWPRTAILDLMTAWRKNIINLEQAKEVQKKYFDRRTKAKDFRPGDLVLRHRETHTADQNRKLLPIWTGPYVVITCNKETKTAQIRLSPDSPIRTVNFDQIIHYRSGLLYDDKTGFLNGPYRSRQQTKPLSLGTQTQSTDDNLNNPTPIAPDFSFTLQAAADRSLIPTGAIPKTATMETKKKTKTTRNVSWEDTKPHGYDTQPLTQDYTTPAQKLPLARTHAGEPTHRSLYLSSDSDDEQTFGTPEITADNKHMPTTSLYPSLPATEEQQTPHRPTQQQHLQFQFSPQQQQYYQQGTQQHHAQPPLEINIPKVPSKFERFSRQLLPGSSSSKRSHSVPRTPESPAQTQINIPFEDPNPYGTRSTTELPGGIHQYLLPERSRGQKSNQESIKKEDQNT